MSIFSEARSLVMRTQAWPRCVAHDRQLEIWEVRFRRDDQRRDRADLICEHACCIYEVRVEIDLPQRLRSAVPPGSVFRNPEFGFLEKPPADGLGVAP